MYVYIYIYREREIHICVYVYVYIYIHMYIHVYIYTHRGASTHVSMIGHTIHIMCIYIYIYTYTYIHIYAHVHICYYSSLSPEKDERACKMLCVLVYLNVEIIIQDVSQALWLFTSTLRAQNL